MENELKQNKPHEKILMCGKQIDLGISKLIQQLWDNNIETIQCCKGGNLVDSESIHNGVHFTYTKNDKIYEMAHIIFRSSHLEQIKQYLPQDTQYLVGDVEQKNTLAEWLGHINGTWASFIHVEK